jgi:hypothetical protein
LLQQHTTNLVRIGVLALPLAGLLALVGLLVNYSVPDPRVDPRGAAQAISSTDYFVSQFAGSVLGSTLLIFGIIALAAYLANTSVKGLTLAAMVLSIAGIALIFRLRVLPHIPFLLDWSCLPGRPRCYKPERSARCQRNSRRHLG